MCGIAWYVSLKQGFPLEDTIKSMNATIEHRGPDAWWYQLFSHLSLALWQRRLSIVDLTSAGHQPLQYNKGVGAFSQHYSSDLMEKYWSSSCSIVFNGEIYNYLEIRNYLETEGYVFSTNCDTEVILAAYDCWGTSCVEHFNGMWAFCIYDPKSNNLFFSRDIAGEKPLYYYYDKDVFAFASELKALVCLDHLAINKHNNLDLDAVDYFFSLWYIPSPHTIYKGVSKLWARECLVFDLASFSIAKQWNYYELASYNPQYDYKSLVNEWKSLLEDSVRLRMMADVPVGTFLSGGLDSSAVTSQMKNLFHDAQLHSFSIGFEGKKYDETHFINIAKDYIGTHHHHYYFHREDFEWLLDQYSLSYDEPFWDYSGFPTHKVCQMAKEHVTVVLSGDGGDEIFAGYNSHLAGRRMDLIYRMPKILRKMISALPAKQNLNGFASWYLFREACRLSLSDKSLFYAKALWDVGIKTDLFKQISIEWLDYALSKWWNSLWEALRIYDLLYNTLSNNFLVKVDRASMAYGVEVRCPFLDKRLLDFAQTIPTEYKMSLFQTKKLMRDIIKDLLPKEIVYRWKQGFSPPLPERINSGDYEDTIQEWLLALQWLNSDLALFYTNTIVPNRNNALYTNYIIRLFLFGLWYKRWVR